MRLRLVMTILTLAIAAMSVPAQNTASNVTAAAQWPLPADFMNTVHKQCAGIAFPQLGECFLRQMKEAGARPEAIAFSRQLGGEGIIATLVAKGKVNVAYVVYPFRANENVACLLVNGTPPRIDVDDLQKLPQDQMKTDAAYQAIAAAHANVSLWPGDRDPNASPVPVTRSPQGGQRFTVSYYLLAGCHACARLGRAQFAFDFTRGGKLAAVRFLSVEAMKP